MPEPWLNDQRKSRFTRLCVFCGTNAGARPEYGAAARELGKLLAEEGIELVYGGASVGIMGELADAVQEGGGHVTGIIPQQLIQKEAAHTGIPDLIVVASMHQRKSQMADLSDGFIALPGGIGTLEGYFEILTWGQLGIHAKPCGVLNIAGYFDSSDRVPRPRGAGRVPHPRAPGEDHGGLRPTEAARQPGEVRAAAGGEADGEGRIGRAVGRPDGRYLSSRAKRGIFSGTRGPGEDPSSLALLGMTVCSPPDRLPAYSFTARSPSAVFPPVASGVRILRRMG